MHYAIFRKILAVLFGLVLTGTGLWASAAEEEEPAAAMEKERVMDPTTGKMVTAPESRAGARKDRVVPLRMKLVSLDPEGIKVVLRHLDSGWIAA